MDIQIQRTAKALNQGNSTCVRSRPRVARFPDQMCGNGAINNAQRFAHDFGLAGKQEPERKRHTEYPLTHWLVG